MKKEILRIDVLSNYTKKKRKSAIVLLEVKTVMSKVN